MYKVLANADAIAIARIARQFPQRLQGRGAVVRSGTASVVSRISSNCPPVRYEARVLGGILGGEEMTMTKLAILILVMAALLFMFIPNLSWANCSRATDLPTCVLHAHS